jgi:hypothetical protein
MPRLSHRAKLGVIALSFVAMFVVLFARPVITQDPRFHRFADTRTFLGIPNALDVLTNGLFALAGFLGIREAWNRTTLSTRWSWIWFFLSVLLVAPGSAYYHWAPTDESLVWDRLPMSTGFMALYVILLAEYVDRRFQRALVPALLTGAASILVWVMTTDLRFYFWIQFSSFVTIPIILALFPSRYDRRAGFFLCLGSYAAAKWVELKDREIFAATGELVSGHSLKHVLAALGLFALWWMVKVRRELN